MQEFAPFLTLHFSFLPLLISASKNDIPAPNNLTSSHKNTKSQKQCQHFTDMEADAIISTRVNSRQQER